MVIALPWSTTINANKRFHWCKNAFSNGFLYCIYSGNRTNFLRIIHSAWKANFCQIVSVDQFIGAIHTKFFHFLNHFGRKTLSCQILRSGISVHWLTAASLIFSNAASLAWEPARVIACSLVMPHCKLPYQRESCQYLTKVKGD